MYISVEVYTIHIHTYINCFCCDELKVLQWKLWLISVSVRMTTCFEIEKATAATVVRWSEFTEETGDAGMLVTLVGD